MTQIQKPDNCGNSPKNQAVLELAIALEIGQLDKDKLNENVIWQKDDALEIAGRDAMQKFMETNLQQDNPPAILKIENAISHGKIGAANGERILKNGRTMRFCHWFEFKSVKAEIVVKIQSYG